MGVAHDPRLSEARARGRGGRRRRRVERGAQEADRDGVGRLPADEPRARVRVRPGRHVQRHLSGRSGQLPVPRRDGHADLHGGPGGRARRLARAEQHASAADLRAGEQDVRMDITRAYWGLVTARESVRVLEQALDRDGRVRRRREVARGRGRAAAQRPAVGAGAARARIRAADSGDQRRRRRADRAGPAARRRPGRDDRADVARRPGDRRRLRSRGSDGGRARGDRPRAAGRADRHDRAAGRPARQRQRGAGRAPNRRSPRSRPCSRPGRTSASCRAPISGTSRGTSGST